MRTHVFSARSLPLGFRLTGALGVLLAAAATATATPGSSDSAKAAGGGRYKVTSNSNLNVRKNPGLKEEKVGSLATGTLVTPTTRNPDGWWKVKSKGGPEGWVHSAYLRPAADFEQEEKTDTDDKTGETGEAGKTPPLSDLGIASHPATSDKYRSKNRGSRDVSIHRLDPLTPGDERSRPLAFESKMAVDADGAGDAWKKDPWGQSKTSLRSRSGEYVNPTKTNYFVLPGGFDRKHPGMKLGDIAAVGYKDKVAYAIYADRGPKAKIGEGSIALAKSLGINPSPIHGGVPSGVTYVVFPGSGTGSTLSQAEINRRGARLLRQTRGK